LGIVALEEAVDAAVCRRWQKDAELVLIRRKGMRHAEPSQVAVLDDMMGLPYPSGDGRLVRVPRIGRMAAPTGLMMGR
jgi:hypothetical protein